MGPRGRRFILASASPRRRELLAAIGVEFEVVTPDVEELTDGDPEAVVLENARRKARAGLRQVGEWPPAVGHGQAALDVGRSAAGESGAPPGTVVLGVDTDVALDGRLLGKAHDEAAARERLEALSGRTHKVLSGLALVESGALFPHTGKKAPRPLRDRVGVARTRVTFRDLDEATIALYLRSGEWRDRAGAYAIQGLGSILVARIQGDFSNVVGLPIPALLDLAPELEKRL
jgi:septum formation protein